LGVGKAVTELKAIHI